MDMENKLRKVADIFCIDYDDMMAKTQKHHLVKPRQMVMHWLKYHTNRTHENIAAIFGMKHCSVDHARKQVSNSLSYDKKYAAQYQAVALIMSGDNWDYEI